jgi:hypothetical protein
MPPLLLRATRTWFPGVVLALAGLVGLMIATIARVDLPWWSWLIPPALIGLTGALASALSLRRQSVAALRREVGRLVANVISDVLGDPSVDPDSTETEQEVLRRLKEATEPRYTSRRNWSRAAGLISPEEVHRLLQLQATRNEEIRTRAESVILELLPPLPRTAKRLLNRLYFLLVVAWSRNLIGVVTPEQLGKWAVLLDQWPTAARAIIRNPRLARELEKLASEPADEPGDGDSFTRKCADCVPPLARDVAGLRRFFRTKPRIGKVAGHLVYLSADPRAQQAAEPPLHLPPPPDFG